MKITAIFLLAACLTATARGHGQTITLSKKNASLPELFVAIYKQTGYTFAYNNENLQGAKKVSIQVNKESLEAVLKICFDQQPFTYEVVDKIIVVKPRPLPPLSPPAIAAVPVESLIDISGKVTDRDGNPLQGASITVKGKSTLGAKTDINGVFVLKGVDANDVITISYSGYQSQNIKTGTTTSFLIKLEVDEKELNEVIINKGYYTEKQRNTVGNVFTVTAKDIEKQPVTNPLLALQGRVPGLEVTQLTGMNGGGVSVRIQGRNSITQGLDPLIIVDGVPFPTQLTGSGHLEFFGIGLNGGSPLNYINPTDIESIDILKDADATAIYGSRAANGAILITTKKGKAGKTKISLNIEQGWSKVNRHVDMLNTRQYLDMRYEAFRNANINFRSSSVSANDLKVWDTTRYTNWQKELIGGTAEYTNINANMSGGTQMLQYMVGGTYNRRTTVFPGDFDDKSGSLHFSINSATTNQRLKLQLTGNYTYDQNQLPGNDLTTTALLMEPNAPSLYNIDGTLNWAPNAAGSSTWNNPLAQVENADFTNSTKTFVSNLVLSYKIIKGLDIRSSFGYTNLQSQLYTPYRLELNKPEDRPYATRQASYGNRNMNTWIIEPQVVYSNSSAKNKFDAVIGSTIQKSTYDYLGLNASGFASDQLMKSLLAAQTITLASDVSGINRYAAAFTRFNYTRDNKYIFNFTARRDGSNRFGDNNKFSNFWSTGAAWIFSDEAWLKRNVPFLNFGKLRASYGITGNDQIADFSYLSVYDIIRPTLLYQNTVGFATANIPNPYLQWEVTKKLQTGIDLGFLHERMNLNITYVRNRSSNQLVNYSIPAITGSFTYIKNLPALIQNTSWEFSLNTVNIKKGNFSWNSGLNVTLPRNKLLSFPGIELTGYAGGVDGVVVGQPLGVLYLNRYAGVNPTTGKYMKLDANGNPSIGNKLKNFVTTNADFYGGLSNTIEYKGFQFDFFFQFVRKRGQRDMYWANGTGVYPGQFFTGFSNQPVSVLDRWQKPGDNSSVSLFYTSSVSNLNSTDVLYNYDPSFIRLKNVSLSWQMPAALVQKAGMQNVKLYYHAQNLHVFTKYRGMDPESGATGLPPLLTVTLGAQIDF